MASPKTTKYGEFSDTTPRDSQSRLSRSVETDDEPSQPRIAYGQRYANWFKRVWEAAPNTEYVSDVKWSAKAPDYAAIAESISQTQCDTLFLPIKPNEAAQLLRHLASLGIWARGLRPRFAEDEEMREITMMAPPEWYDLQPGPILSHYGNHILIPVMYASENQDGQIFARRIEDKPAKPSTNLAVLLDAIRALERANQKTMKDGVPAGDAIIYPISRRRNIGFLLRERSC